MADDMHSEVRDTGTAMGPGVFALRRFAAGEIVETCELEIFRMPFANLPQELKNRVFDWEFLAGYEGTRTYSIHALAGGNGGMYNDNNPANMRYEAVPGKELLQFIAVRDIEVGEELTVNYSSAGGGNTSQHDNWFKKRNITPLRR
jgi:hypothetical protein